MACSQARREPRPPPTPHEGCAPGARNVHAERRERSPWPPWLWTRCVFPNDLGPAATGADTRSRDMLPLALPFGFCLTARPRATPYGVSHGRGVVDAWMPARARRVPP